LKNAVGTIHRAIGDGIDHVVATTDMMESSWTGLQTPSIKMGNEKMFFPDPNRIGCRKKLLDKSSLVLNPFDGNIREGFENGLCDRILFSLFIEINFFNLEGQHADDHQCQMAKCQKSKIPTINTKISIFEL
jgi:hypothetical protein